MTGTDSLYWQALNLSLDRAMASDPDIFVIGEDVGLYGGSYRVTEGLYAKYGEWRVRDTPISENSFTGLGVGAAMAGLRPVVEIMTINFSLLAMDALVNMALKAPLMSGGQFRVPLVIRMPGGVAHQLAAQHSQRLEAMFMGIPGLTIAAPSTPQDAYWQLGQALRQDSPVIVLEHELLYFTKGTLDTSLPPPPIHRAAIRRPGRDLTIVTYSGMVSRCLDAAEQLALDGIAVEVIDLRSLRPIDWDTILESVERTHRILVVEEDSVFAGAGSEIAARVSESGFYFLDAPPGRLGAMEIPIPYNKSLESSVIPTATTIANRVRTDYGKREEHA
jgi:pyruvate dehydrogenase E1 component beta subunit